MSKNNEDYLKRFVEKQSDQSEWSPFDPPDAYSEQNIEEVPYSEMHPFLQRLMNEHQKYLGILEKFETSLVNWKNNGWIFDDEINRNFKNFFEFQDANVPSHNAKEEKLLFPKLKKKLIEKGEHNSKNQNHTGVDVIEDEHIKVAQASALVLNFLGLGSRLEDDHSRQIVFQTAYEQGMSIIETMNLHIHREDKILFQQAIHTFSKDELDELDENTFLI